MPAKIRRQGSGARAQTSGGIYPAVGAYRPRQTANPKKKRAWPWLLLTVAAVLFLRAAFPIGGPDAAAPLQSPSAAASVFQDGGGTKGTEAPGIRASVPAVTAAWTPEAAATAQAARTAAVTPSPTAAPTDTPAPGYAVLKQGMRGEDVRTMQQALITLGYLALNKDDGDFGSGTKNALASFQKVNGLTADGIAEEKTLALLYGGMAKHDPDPFVWIVEKGYAYHSSPKCSNMKNPYQIKKSEAERMGRTPCKKCYK